MVIENGLRLLYNLCYRCESAHEALLICCRPQSFFATIHHHHSGDPGVMRHCRKLELTMLPEGWRGNVEDFITDEMKEAEIKSIDFYLDDKSGPGDINVEETDEIFAETKYQLENKADEPGDKSDRKGDGYDDDYKNYSDDKGNDGAKGDFK
jgi:hypothetical protein